MKNRLIPFVALFGLLLASSQLRGQEAVLTFDSEVIDFGTISRKNNKLHFLRVNNRSESDIRLIEGRISFGYDIVRLPSLIQAQSTDSIGVRISPELLSGPFRKVLTLITSADPSVYTVRISGKIID
ncbi:MAG: DUF1573 domain-containing protein [Bacteroidetes bacterium]|nr:DUF1573 domain-containing protein [Bacteroidota bacterium]